jgi:hypothetical protein
MTWYWVTFLVFTVSLTSVCRAATELLQLKTIADASVRQFAQAKFQNREVVGQATASWGPGDVLTVRYPKGSIDPVRSITGQAPWGGAFFRLPLRNKYDCAVLTYAVRFAPGFDFGRGGKLPGLGGGDGNTGGRVPSGFDGFSVRYVWRDHGRAELYAYVPGIEGWGRSLGQGAWDFEPGRWMNMEMLLRLNKVGYSDGELIVRVDGKEVWHETEVLFRKRPGLRIDQLIFDTFFGGNDASWAATKDESIEFKNLKVQDDGC